MNGPRARLLTGLAFWLVMECHAGTAVFSNTPQGMLWFHGSAAMADMFLLYLSSKLLNGGLCDDMQGLCLVSIIVNFIGWLAYLYRISPVFYNEFMWGLSYVQWARLLLVDRHDDLVGYLGFGLVPGSHRGVH